MTNKMEGNNKRLGTLHEVPHSKTVVCHAPPRCRPVGEVAPVSPPRQEHQPVDDGYCSCGVLCETGTKFRLHLAEIGSMSRTQELVSLVQEWDYLSTKDEVDIVAALKWKEVWLSTVASRLRKSWHNPEVERLIEDISKLDMATAEN